MNRTIVIVALMLAAGGALCGCVTPHAYVRSGDEKSVEVVYGGDFGSAEALARRHCAEFGRVPRLAIPGTDLALFDCVSP